jgi:hypothetical protein
MGKKDKNGMGGQPGGGTEIPTSAPPTEEITEKEEPKATASDAGDVREPHYMPTVGPQVGPAASLSPAPPREVTGETDHDGPDYIDRLIERYGDQEAEPRTNPDEEVEEEFDDDELDTGLSPDVEDAESREAAEEAESLGAIGPEAQEVASTAEITGHQMDEAVLNQLLDVVNAAEGNPSGRTPLMEAAESGDAEVVRSLLDLGTEIDAIDKHGENALMIAAAFGNVDVVRVLVAAGADVSISAPYGWTAPMFAESWGQVEVANILKVDRTVDEEADTALVVTSSGEEPLVA